MLSPACILSALNQPNGSRMDCPKSLLSFFHQRLSFPYPPPVKFWKETKNGMSVHIGESTNNKCSWADLPKARLPLGYDFNVLLEIDRKWETWNKSKWLRFLNSSTYVQSIMCSLRWDIIAESSTWLGIFSRIPQFMGRLSFGLSWDISSVISS